MFTAIMCPTCQHKFTVPEAAKNKRQKCPNCLSPFVAGKAAEEANASPPSQLSATNKTMLGETAPPITFNCPGCKKPLQVASIEAGTKRSCPECGQRLQVPAASSRPAPHPNLNKTILAAAETKPQPTSVQPGHPAAASVSSASAGTAPSSQPAPRPRTMPNRGLLIGGGLLAVGFVFLILLACLAAIVIGIGPRKPAEDPLAAATEANRRKEQEAAERRAEQETRRQEERAAAERRAEQMKRAIEKNEADAAEAKRRLEKDELDRRVREDEKQTLRDKEIALAKKLQDEATQKALIDANLAKLKDFQVNDVLTGAQFDRYRTSSYCKIHAFPMKAGGTYVIGLFSAWDNYLHLEDPRGVRLASDDDSGGSLNARIIFNCPADGLYRIIVTSYGGGVTGPYTLKVHQPK